MLDKVKKFNSIKEELTKTMKEFVKNKNIPLDERWNTFIEAGVGDTSWRNNFIFENDDFLYEGPLYMRKYEVRSIEDIFNSLVDAHNEEEFEFTEDQQNDFKEYCLEKFYIKMKFDW